jgi:hypothetical protein
VSGYEQKKKTLKPRLPCLSRHNLEWGRQGQVSESGRLDNRLMFKCVWYLKKQQFFGFGFMLSFSSCALSALPVALLKEKTTNWLGLHWSQYSFFI